MISVYRVCVSLGLSKASIRLTTSEINCQSPSSIPTAVYGPVSTAMNYQLKEVLYIRSRCIDTANLNTMKKGVLAMERTGIIGSPIQLNALLGMPLCTVYKSLERNLGK